MFKILKAHNGYESIPKTVKLRSTFNPKDKVVRVLDMLVVCITEDNLIILVGKSSLKDTKKTF